METPTLYEILEVSEDASPQDLRAAHRRLMRQLHPDMPTGDPQRAALVNDAWVRLSDPAERASYDLALRYERERAAAGADDATWAASEEDDAQGRHEAWDDGWGTVSGDEDDAPQDLFDDPPADEPDDEPRPAEGGEPSPPGEPGEADDGDDGPGGPAWDEPVDDAGQDWDEQLPPPPRPVAKGAGAGEPTPDRSRRDPRVEAGLDAWAQVEHGRAELSWWPGAEQLRGRLDPEPRLGWPRAAGEQLAQLLLGPAFQALLLVGLMFPVFPLAVAAMNIMVLSFTHGLIATAIVLVLCTWVGFLPNHRRPFRRDAVLLALPLVIPVPGVVMPIQGLLVAAQRLIDPTLPHARELPLAVLCVWASYLLVAAKLLWSPLNKPTDRHPAWGATLVPAGDFVRHRQWGDPARRLAGDERGVGQALTSQLLDEVARIPGVRIVHNLRPDPASSLLISHVVMTGRQLLVVESHCLPGGTWTVSSDGLRPRGAGDDALVEVEADRAAKRLGRRFLRVRAQPLVVIHSRDDRPIRLLREQGSDGPQVMAPGEFAEAVGRLCVRQKGRRARRRVLSELVQLMD